MLKKLKSLFLFWKSNPNRNALEVGEDSKKEITDFADAESKPLAEQGEKPSTIDIDFDNIDIEYCHNCQTPLRGSFCANCGQKNTNLARPIWFLLSDMTEDIVSKDSKLFRTIFHIIFWPGSLTRDFMDGKRARFIPPVRFYLLCTLTFFITLAVADVAILKMEFVEKEVPQSELAVDPTQEPQDSEGEYTGGRMGASREEVLAGLEEARSKVLARLEVEEMGMGQTFLNKWAVRTASPSGITIASSEGGTIGNFGVVGGMFLPAEPSENAFVLPDNAFDEEKGELHKALDENKDGGFVSFILERSLKSLDGIIHVSQDPRRLNNTLNDWLSRVMIFLLPFFALILRLFYWKRENCLMKQLVFSLHFHSAVFLMMTFLIIAQAVWGAAVSASMFYAIVPIYLFIAMKVASKQGLIRTTFKFLFVSLFYLITLSITMAFTLMLSFSEI